MIAVWHCRFLSVWMENNTKHLRTQTIRGSKATSIVAGPIPNGSANVPVQPLAFFIGYSVIRPDLQMQTVRGHESPLQLRTRTVCGPYACGRGLSADVKFVDSHTSGATVPMRVVYGPLAVCTVHIFI